MRAMLRVTVLLFSASFAALVAAAHAQRSGAVQPALANRTVYLDEQGIVRWRDNHEEGTLFGANYVLPSASDYRAAGYLHADRKRMIDEDMAQFARMGWDGLRLAFWGDWEASDSAGNLIANDHLDLLDYLIARARERGIYMLFSPIQLYSSNWPDALEDSSMPGFGRRFGKARMGTDPAAIAAQVTYLRQILAHVNPYTGVALKDEPAILFIELVNEPWHHPEDLEGSIRYINALTDAVRSTGCRRSSGHRLHPRGFHEKWATLRPHFRLRWEPFVVRVQERADSGGDSRAGGGTGQGTLARTSPWCAQSGRFITLRAPEAALVSCPLEQRGLENHAGAA